MTATHFSTLLLVRCFGLRFHYTEADAPHSIPALRRHRSIARGLRKADYESTLAIPFAREPHAQSTRPAM